MDKIIQSIERHHRILVAVFFSALLVLGWTVYRDYGVHWDEIENQGFGYRSLNTIGYVLFKKAPDPNGLLGPAAHDWYHGGFFETLLAFLSKYIFRLQDSRDIILMRHMASFISYWLGLMAFYILCSLHFKKRSLALLGLLFFVLTPPVFSHAFYNTVDIAFMSVFTVNVLTLILLLRRTRVPYVLLHALVCAISFNVRFQGIGIAFLTIVMLIGTVISGRKEQPARHYAAMTALFVLSLMMFTYALMPLLWIDFPTQARYLMQRLSESHWHQTILYLGEYTSGNQQPWHYPLVWIAISIPLLYTFLMLIGLVRSLFQLSRNERYPGEKSNVIIFLFWFLTPLLIVVTQKSAYLYDGWRHLFFIYPALVLFVLEGCRVLWGSAVRRGRLAQGLLISVLVLSFLWTARFMVTAHPYQHLYFNSLAGSDMRQIKERFELDYWGLSYREGLEYILAHDKRDGIRIHAQNVPGYYNIGILPEALRRRFGATGDNEETDYFLSNYRWHKEEYSLFNEVFSVKMGNAKIMTVYRVKDQ